MRGGSFETERMAREAVRDYKEKRMVVPREAVRDYKERKAILALRTRLQNEAARIARDRNLSEDERRSLMARAAVEDYRLRQLRSRVSREAAEAARNRCNHFSCNVMGGAFIGPKM